MKEPHHRGDSSVSGRKLSVKIRKLRKIENQMDRRAAMDMEKVQAVFLCHKIKNQTEK